jgi:hypothetical protein
MKNMLLPLDIEGAGFFYGMSLLARTLIPGYLYRFNKNAAVYESVLNHRLGTGVPVNRQVTVPLVESVAIVKALLI